MIKQNQINPKSIKHNLITTLTFLISITLIIVYLISFLSTKEEIQEVFDANLIKSSKLIFGLINHEINEEGDLNSLINFEKVVGHKFLHKYEYKIHSQAWKDGELVYNSDDSITAEIPDYEGFRDIVIDGKKWRAFSFYNKNLELGILTIEEYSIRNELIFKILFSLTAPLILSFIPLFFIIRSTVNKKIRPLNKLSSKIEKMSSRTIEQFQDSNIPLELQPFINSFNSLMKRLSESMESERNFTDYAAHELKTPLSAIKIQAQILAKNKKIENEESLKDLLGGIDRATYMVNQLLTLARLEPDNKNIEKEKVNLKRLTEFVIKNYIEKAKKKNITLSLETKVNENELGFLGNKTYLEIMIGNLIDNSIKYSSKNSDVSVLLDKKRDNSFLIKISNLGDNITSEEIEKIFNNFYRINKKVSDDTGCGLGLAIVKKIVELHQGSILFKSVEGINSVEISLINQT